MEAVHGDALIRRLSFSNWEGTQTAHLEDVPAGTTIGQVVVEAAHAMQMPFKSFYKALVRGRELNHDETLGDAGIEEDARIELVPEVSAG